MHVLFVALALMTLLTPTLAISAPSATEPAGSPAIIKVSDWYPIKVYRYEIKNNHVYYRFRGGGSDVLDVDISRVESITDVNANTTALPPIIVEGRTFPRVLSFGHIDPNAKSHPEFMHTFSDWLYDFFAFEPTLRKAALEMAHEIKDKGDNGKNLYDGMNFFSVLEQKTGLDYINSFDLEANYEEHLNREERSDVDSTFKALTFYLYMLPGEEGIRAGLFPQPTQHESETPAAIRAHIKALLAKYRTPAKDLPDTKKEIKGVWEKMRQALKDGDVDKASSYFSETTKDNYKKSFQALKEAGKLSDVANDISDMSVNRVEGGWAEGDIQTTDKEGKFSFIVRFLMEDEGIWRIEGF